MVSCCHELMFQFFFVVEVGWRDGMDWTALHFPCNCTTSRSSFSPLFWSWMSGSLHRGPGFIQELAGKLHFSLHALNSSVHSYIHSLKEKILLCSDTVAKSQNGGEQENRDQNDLKIIIINLDFVSAGFFSRKTCGKSCSPQGV